MQSPFGLDERRSVLLQNSSEIMSILSPSLIAIFNHAAQKEFSFVDFVRWVFCRQIQLIYMLPIEGFEYRDQRFEAMYYRLRTAMPNLDVIFSHYIRAPRIYTDTCVSVRFMGKSLAIFYTTNEV